MAGTDFSHLTTDELIKGIKALDLPDYIRSKSYGIDVRETLAQMTEMTIQLGVNMGLSPDEALKWARKLQESVSQSEFDSWVATLLDGGPSIFMNTLNELKTAYPNGASGVALVRETDPAKIYVWTGSAWEDFGDYQGIEVADDSITYEKITFDDEIATRLVNLTTNGNLSTDTDGNGWGDNWYYGGANATEPRIANNTQYWKPTTANVYSSAIRYNDKPILNGHVYYVSWEQTNVMQVFLGQGQNISYNEGNGFKEKVVTSATAIDKNIIFFAKTANVEAGVKNLMVFDLTETFGAGKEPSLAEIKTNISGWFLEKNLGINRELVSRISTLEDIGSGSKSINNLLIFGDSITETATINEDGTGYTDRTATNWPTFLSSNLEIGTLKNYARSGATFKDQNIAGDKRKSLSEQVEMAIANSESADVIVVSIGTNDGTGSLGNYDTAMGKTTLDSLDKGLLYEAIRYNFWKLREHYPNAKMFCALPIQRAAYEPPTALIDAITKMAKRYNFIIIDALNESGIVRDFEVSQGAGRYLRDGLHPNESGKELLGAYYSNEIFNKI